MRSFSALNPVSQRTVPRKALPISNMHTLKLPRTCSSALCQLVCVQRSTLCYYLGFWASCSFSNMGPVRARQLQSLGPAFGSRLNPLLPFRPLGYPDEGVG